MPEIEPEMAMKKASAEASNFGGMGTNSAKKATSLPRGKGPPARTRPRTPGKPGGEIEADQLLIESTCRAERRLRRATHVKTTWLRTT
jgi:hypothetical protein